MRGLTSEEVRLLPGRSGNFWGSRGNLWILKCCFVFPQWSGDPPPARAVTGKISLCLCAFSFPELCAPKLPESRGERILFHGQPNLSPIFREISCAHFSWKLKDENRRNISPFFRRIFRPCRQKISPEFRSRGFSAEEH